MLKCKKWYLLLLFNNNIANTVTPLNLFGAMGEPFKMKVGPCASCFFHFYKSHEIHTYMKMRIISTNCGVLLYVKNFISC